jgi:squalene synthase HpnC
LNLAPTAFLDDAEAMQRTWALPEALSYTRWLATAHYENFHVVSFLLPKALHQDFYNVYAYCRWADDLGDEIDDPRRSLELLDWWGSHLDGIEEARHPVFVALRETIRSHQLPLAPFRDLLTAFRQDQSVRRYRDWEQLLGYCRNSANPVGRLVLMLMDSRDEERFRLSDEICTGLQLANFWQDVSRDFDIGRVYLPTELLERHGVSEEQLSERRFTPGFRAAMVEAVDYASACFERGKPLVGMVDRRLALDLDLFLRGGIRVLEKISAQDYDVLSRRPEISKSERAMLLFQSLVRTAFSRPSNR